MDLRSVVRSDEERLQADRQFPLFLLAIGAVVAAATLFVALVVSAACGGDDPKLAPGGTIDGPTPTEAVPGATPTSPTPTAAATGTTPANASPSPVGSPPATALPTKPAKIVACGDTLAPLDKEHRLSEDCAPGDLQQLAAGVSYGQQFMRSAAAGAFTELVAEAAKAGFSLVAVSAYRSYQTQVVTYQSNVQSGGQDYADRTSARPGHSEHQLGTTVDVSTANAGYQLEGFAGTPEAGWLAENSWKYGFIVSYPGGKEGITGYAYEPWHIRFVGKDVAGRVRSSGLTLHEYLLR